MLSIIVFEIKKFKKPHIYVSSLSCRRELRSCLEGNVTTRLPQISKGIGFLEFALPIMMKSSGVHSEIQNIFQLTSKILPTGQDTNEKGFLSD